MEFGKKLENIGFNIVMRQRILDEQSVDVSLFEEDYFVKKLDIDKDARVESIDEHDNDHELE